jgi:hypothetical protein
MSSFSEGLTAVPNAGGKSSEYELAEQDAQHHRPRSSAGTGDGLRPDQRPPRGNPAIEDVELQRGRDQLDRVIAK